MHEVLTPVRLLSLANLGVQYEQVIRNSEPFWLAKLPAAYHSYKEANGRFVLLHLLGSTVVVEHRYYSLVHQNQYLLSTLAVMPARSVTK